VAAEFIRDEDELRPIEAMTKEIKSFIDASIANRRTEWITEHLVFRPIIGDVLLPDDRMHRQGANEANTGRIQQMSNAAGAFERREERVANCRTAH